LLLLYYQVALIIVKAIRNCGLCIHASLALWDNNKTDRSEVYIDLKPRHGAIIDREYRLPCVTGVLDSAELIETGDLVTVDGHLGIVTVGEPALREVERKKEACKKCHRGFSL
jgi:hypothetical protein